MDLPTTNTKRLTWANRKSAKPRSGEIDANWDLLAGFTCNSKLGGQIHFSVMILNLEAKADAEDEGGDR